MIKKGEETQHIEKWMLRKAFDDELNPYLPSEVLWRQKEQFSDGVGYSWIDGIKAHAAEVISDADLEMAKVRFPHNPPMTKEAAYYRKIFHQPSRTTTTATASRRRCRGGPRLPARQRRRSSGTRHGRTRRGRTTAAAWSLACTTPPSRWTWGSPEMVARSFLGGS